jgi:hypothetical protein
MYCVSLRPMYWNVLPASVLLYTPPPHDVDCRLLGSPVPTYRIDGSEGAIARSPIEE